MKLHSFRFSHLAIPSDKSSKKSSASKLRREILKLQNEIKYREEKLKLKGILKMKKLQIHLYLFLYIAYNIN